MDEAHADGGEGSEAGLTLVELLVAMALLSFVALLATQGVRAVQTMMPVADRIEGASEIAAVRGHLASAIEEAMATLALGAPAAFEGRPDGMRFLAPSDPFLEVGGIADIRLGVRDGESGSGLDLVESRATAREAGDGKGTATVLLSNVASLTLAYRTIDGDWTPDWPKGAGLPALVSVEIAFPPGDARRFRRLLVHPATSSLANPPPGSAAAQAAPQSPGP